MSAISAFTVSRKFLVLPPISVRLVRGQSLYVSLLQGKLMRRIILLLFAALAVTSVEAAWYQKNDGTIVDPIQSVLGGNLAYTGNNLEPNANLDSADLTGANLDRARTWSGCESGRSKVGRRGHELERTCTYANLTSADFNYAVLGSADLTGADLTGADLTGADLVVTTRC